jgi:GNAT superfamily N-acetyltransferase
MQVGQIRHLLTAAVPPGLLEDVPQPRCGGRRPAPEQRWRRAGQSSPCSHTTCYQTCQAGRRGELGRGVGTRCWIGDFVLRELEVWVADDAGHVVGFAALGDDVLEHLYVHPQAQNRGVGATLLTVSKECRPRGLRLWVFQKNVGARRFYERHGFTLVRLTEGLDNEEREPDALYEWRP